ncbi:CBS domain-containing protein [uncultured Desulfuromonas sp.]|uniref:CBS domain-containing protein n=1 Tax=uncultured Desulfuromonas sp. TaxID=181013 RepID=UPI002607CA5C|nr:CBS domain-containing protein [uncultured Desulfuromonas sp.]
MHDVPILTALAIILFGALAGGRLAVACRIPRVTGYLLVGLFCGPSFTGLVGLPPLLTTEALHGLNLLYDLALALILLNIGGLFKLEHLRRWGNRITLFSFSEIGLTFALVSGSTFLLNLFLVQKTVGEMDLFQTSLAFALFLGIISIATAPAATLMVIREYEAEGPVTGTVLTLVGFNNLVSALGFAVIAHFLIRPEETLGLLLLHMAGPIVLGAVLGFGLSIWGQRLELPSEHKILLIGGVASTVGLCRVLHLDPMLASMALGIALANASPRWHLLTQSLRQVDYILYVAFFVLAGAHLHIETLSHIGVLGVAYVVARTAGKWLGALAGARMGRFGQRERDFVGIALLAQAGMAIGLAGTLARSWPEGGKLLETVILGSVVVFELIGPLAVRHGLVRAGEVPILSLLQKRTPQGAMEGLHSVVQHFRSSLGIPAGHRLRDPGDILVRHLMRQNVETIRNDTPFNELLHLISHSRYDRFPVVDRSENFVGMIDYTEIRNLLFEPTLVALVVAEDLATSALATVAPDMPLREALQTMQKHRDISFFPVVDPDEPKRLLGILSQNDALSAFRRLNA